MHRVASGKGLSQMELIGYLSSMSRAGTPILPALDGPLRPDRALDVAERVMQAEQLSNVVVRGDGEQICASGAAIRVVGGQELGVTPARISAMASSSEGLLAVGLETGGVVVIDRAGNRQVIDGGQHLNCPTAIAFLEERMIVVANGSARRGPGAWRADLMAKAPSGSIVICNLDGGRAERVLDGLAWPAGLAVAPSGNLLVTESARSRVLSVPIARPIEFRAVWEDIPAYPGRLARCEQGEYWVACLSVRNQLVEAILADSAFCARMISELDECDWMAPAVRPRADGAAPLQVNALPQEGVVKPWAASLSYGLVVRCDADMRPKQSFHSRADGRRHGIGSIAVSGQDVLVSRQRTDELLCLRHAIVAGDRHVCFT